MGYFTENPHVNYNQGNYDYFVNKLKELDKELKDFETEVHAKFNEIDDEFVQVRDEMLEQARVLRSEIAAVKAELLEDFSEYQNEIAETISSFETSVNTTINNFETVVNNQITQLENDIDGISDNIEEYVADHIDEWQISSLTVDVTVNLTQNTETYGNVGLGAAVPANKTPLILGVYYTTRSGGGPYINHNGARLVANNKIYPLIETVYANDEWNITVRDYETSTPSSRVYTVIYTVV